MKRHYTSFLLCSLFVVFQSTVASADITLVPEEVVKTSGTIEVVEPTQQNKNTEDLMRQVKSLMDQNSRLRSEIESRTALERSCQLLKRDFDLSQNRIQQLTTDLLSAKREQRKFRDEDFVQLKAQADLIQQHGHDINVAKLGSVRLVESTVGILVRIPKSAETVFDSYASTSTITKLHLGDFLYYTLSKNIFRKKVSE